MDEKDIFEQTLRHFQVVKRIDSKAICKCPAHQDAKASLTISMGKRGVLFHCFAGCSFDSILQAAGLKPEDTFFESKERPRQDSEWKSFVESREKRKIEGVYHYRNINDGKYCFSKIRLSGKKIIYGHFQNQRFVYGLPNNTPRKDFCAVYSDLNKIRGAIETEETVFVVEGEKDVDTLTKYGYASFTYGGSGDWQTEFSSLLLGANVVVLADNDDPGKKVANKILSDIRAVVKSAKVIVPMPNIEKADITDFFEAGHTQEDFERLINETEEKSTRKSLISILRDIHAEQFETTDKGFGLLFATIFKDKHRYNPRRKDWMLYDGKRWVDDPEGLNARKSAKQLSDALLKFAVSVDADGKYLKSVLPLCNLRNRTNMLTDAKDVFPVTNEQLDQNDYLLNVQNGTLDLTGNDPKFIEHDPDLLLSKICRVDYKKNANCPEWLKFLDVIMCGNKDKIKYIQKIFGLALTGDTSQETMFFFYGATTRNGKSSCIETILYLLGDYGITMKPESLATKQNNDSRQASGDIARLADARLVNASEPPKRMLFDTALLKSMLGRDSITARHLHQREFTFIPKFKLIINTNFLPTITDDTVFSSGRINVISFDRHFEPHEQDKGLKDRLRQKEELSGILNWCIEGLRLYRMEGLTPPKEVLEATTAYRSASDKIGNFLNECLIKTPGVNIKAGDAYNLYAEWCSDNGYGTENKGNFFGDLKNKGVFASSGTVKGMTVKNIVKGYSIDSDFAIIPNDLATPFD